MCSRCRTGCRYAEAALVEPFSCCLRGQEALDVGYEDTVLIVGAGPIGAFNVMLAKLAGAKKIIVANRSQPRLDRMAEFGADVLINVGEQDLVAGGARRDRRTGRRCGDHGGVQRRGAGRRRCSCWPPTAG